MIILTNAGTDKLQVVTDAAVTVDVHASWQDLASGTVTPGRTNTAISTAATTDVVATPAASTVRNVKTVNIRNKHASSSVTVTVVYDQNGTDYELHKDTLAAGDVLEYVEGVGWFKVAVSSTPDFRSYTLGADQSNSTTTPTEVTGLTVATEIGNFIFQYYLILQSAATTTGHKLSCNYDGSESTFAYWLEWLTAATTASDDVPDQDHTAAPGGVFSGFSARAGGVAGIGATTDVDTANADVLYVIRGIMVVTAAGNLELWHGSEAAAASTVKAGSSLILVKTS